MSADSEVLRLLCKAVAQRDYLFYDLHGHTVLTQDEINSVRAFAEAKTCPKCAGEMPEGECVNIDCPEFHAKPRPAPRCPKCGSNAVYACTATGCHDWICPCGYIYQPVETKPRPAVTVEEFAGKVIEIRERECEVHCKYDSCGHHAAVVAYRLAFEMMGGGA